MNRRLYNILLCRLGISLVIIGSISIILIPDPRSSFHSKVTHFSYQDSVTGGQKVETGNPISMVPTKPSFSVLGMLNPLQFHYLIQEPSLCSLKFTNATTLIYVHTNPSNFRYRNIIRNTWGKRNFYNDLGFFTLFFMGKTLDINLATAVQTESDQYHDIIQEDFVDTYHNLSYKGVSALKWITNHCSQLEYIVKVDDDMFVNVFGLNRFLRKMHLRNDPYPSSFLCMVWRRMIVLRDPKSKWYVKNETYNGKYYPTYCSGSAYIIPRSIVPRLYNATFATRFIWVDDVYITGFLAQTANVTHENIGRYFVMNPSEYRSTLIYGDGIFGHISGDDQIAERYSLWHQIVKIEGN